MKIERRRLDSDLDKWVLSDIFDFVPEYENTTSVPETLLVLFCVS